jgi:hypothetical protein
MRDVVERPIAKAGGPRDPMEEEFSTRSAIEAGLNRLDFDQTGALLVGATMGFPNCGVGSGPAIRDWLATLSDEIGEPLVFSGDTGVSYAPASYVDFVRRVFDPIDLHLDRVELAPVAASRCLGLLPSGAMTLGSGVAWSARILNNHVLEAFETMDGAADEVLRFVVNNQERELDVLEGVSVDPGALHSRGLSIGSLGPAVGVAVGLLDFDASNLLEGTSVSGGAQYASPPRGARSQQPFLEPDQSSSSDHFESQPPAAGSVQPPASGDLRSSDPWGTPTPDYAPPSSDPFGPGPAANGMDEADSGRPGQAESEDTHNLRRLPRRLERSRELISAPQPAGARPRDPRPGSGVPDDMVGIEAFAHPEDAGSSRGFHVSDFVIGALGMLAIMLVVALLVL